MSRNILLSVALLTACGTTDTRKGGQSAAEWRGHHVETSTFGADDNSEVVKMLPSGQHALLIASKARKVTLLTVTTSGLEALRSASLFTDDASESELTHLDVDTEGRFAAITRTLPIKNGDELVDCQGSLVFVDVTDSDRFGEVLSELPIGPMPDAVDISPDGRWAVTADEVDYNDGKCPLADVHASISVIELPSGSPTNATVRAVVSFPPAEEGARREPEQVSFASDSLHIAATLQDTHELLTARIDELIDDGQAIRQVSSDDLAITRLPNRSTGAEPWPDGVASFVDGSGQDYFVVAGEYNDTFSVFSLDGELINHIEIQPSDMPSDLPRNIEDWSHAPFRPDSVAPFSFQGHTYLAFSLKHAGAVGVWLADDAESIEFVSVVKIGRADGGTPITESTIGTEGISAGSNGLVITANEDESSASLVGPIID